jgi:predicted nucleotidyltransferase
MSATGYAPPPRRATRLTVTGQLQVGAKTLVHAVRPVLSLLWLQQHAAGLPPLDLTTLARTVRVPRESLRAVVLHVLRHRMDGVRERRLRRRGSG